jgi:hypothetical protein
VFDQIKGDKMGWSCAMHGGDDGKCTQNFDTKT